MQSINFPGSRWWKFDFHTHTPIGSSDYRGDRTINPQDWLEHHRSRQIHCVVVTDHNGGEWLNQLKETLKNLKEVDASWRDFFVLPGVEISCSSGVHVLAVLDENCDSKNVAALVGKCGYQGTLGDSNAVTTLSVVDVMRVIQGAPWNGVAIPAHVDCNKGLFKAIHDAATLQDVLKAANALQVVDPGNLTMLVKDETCQRQLNKLARVQGSDSHNAATAPSDAFTWLKMTKPSLEGLKLALAEPELSVRSSHLTPEIEPKQWIQSLEISDLDKRRQKLRIEFNPWLNTVIGGRGSGKSSIVECLRLSLGRGSEAAEQLEDGHEVSKGISGFVRDMVTKNTTLKVTVSGAGALQGRYRYEWAKDSSKQSVMRPDANDVEEWVTTEIKHSDVLTDFPVRLLSQKQVHALATRPGGLRQYIDASRCSNQREKIIKLKATFHASIKSFAEARLESRRCQDELKGWPQVKDDLAQVNESLDAYVKQGISDVLQTLQGVRAEKKAFNDFYDGVLADAKDLKASIESITLKEWQINLPSTHSSESETLVIAWRKSFESIRSAWQNINAQVLALHAQVDSLKSDAAFTCWNTKVSGEEEKCLLTLHAVKTQLGGQLQHVSVLQQTKEDLEKKDNLFKAIEQELSHANTLVSQRYQEMWQARKAITEARQTFVDQINNNSSEETLKITLHCSAHYDQNCVDELKQLLGFKAADYVNAFFGDLEMEESTGISATLNRQPERLEEFKRAMDVFVVSQNTSIQTILEADLGSERSHIRSALKSISQQKIDELWAWFPEDRVQVQFRQTNSDAWQDISEGSAGQKTGAMLSFILNEGDEPLILDQPEDDLDNENVSKLVVEQLRQSKSRRQVIVVTHNANIVVNGDAELVIPMAFRGGQIQMDPVGGLQDAVIRKKICDVMEGGEKAFRNRYQRVLESLVS